MDAEEGIALRKWVVLFITQVWGGLGGLFVVWASHVPLHSHWQKPLGHECSQLTQPVASKQNKFVSSGGPTVFAGPSDYATAGRAHNQQQQQH